MKCRSCEQEAGSHTWCASCIAALRQIKGARVILVCGPPGAGKSTFVARHRRPGDLVWDFDLVLQAVAGGKMHDRPAGAVGAVLAMREAFLSRIRGSLAPGRIWIVDCAPLAAERARFKREFGASVVLLDTDELTCRARLAERGPEWPHLASEWWADYDR